MAGISIASKKTVPCPARERLLDAAAVVFARDGIAASTTREIAREAGVNEVTIYRLFQHKQNLKRVLIGEIQLFNKEELEVIRGMFEPTRQHLITRLRRAQEAGLARKDTDPCVVADQVNAILFMGALRKSLPVTQEYSVRNYIEACVETIVRAIETPGGGKEAKKRKR